MRYYTAEEAANKLKVSKGHIYELVKRGELKKKDGLGRTIRIPSSELKNVNVERNYFSYDEELVQVIETHLGKVRKIKGKDEYVITDLTKILNLKDSYSIVRRLNKNNYKKIEIEDAKKLGLFANNSGLLLINYKGICEYSDKSRSKNSIDFDRLLNELKVTDYKQVGLKQAEDVKRIQIFSNKDFGQVRGFLFNNEPYFVGKDVATILGYAKPRNAIAAHVDEEDKKGAPIKGDRGGIQEMTVINESGLYSLIFSSKLPSAKKFKRWVTDEVLPTIRKTGGYVDNADKFTDNYFLNLSLDVRRAIRSELITRNRELVNRKRELIAEAQELKREYDINNKAIEQLNIQVS